MCYSLAVHPDVLKKLREEILALLPGGSPYEDIRGLKYRACILNIMSFPILKSLCNNASVRACLNETLRLFPPVPINERASVKATTLPRASPDEKPYYMPGPHSSVTYFPLLMQRRKDLWGEDADRFNPERWLNEQRVMELTKDPFKFLPFNAGPRICLGQVSVVVTSSNCF